jgi:hypothetical protein
MSANVLPQITVTTALPNHALLQSAMYMLHAYVDNNGEVITTGNPGDITMILVRARYVSRASHLTDLISQNTIDRAFEQFGIKAVDPQARRCLERVHILYRTANLQGLVRFYYIERVVSSSEICHDAR